MRTAFFIAALALTMGNVQGQEKTSPASVLKKQNPNELYVYYMQDDDCNGSYERVVENELVQSRIKRKEELPEFREVFLDVRITCVAVDEKDRDYQVYDVTVRFGEVVPVTDHKPDEYSFMFMYFAAFGYANTGISPTAEMKITNTLRSNVESSLADYLKANFDL